MLTAIIADEELIFILQYAHIDEVTDQNVGGRHCRDTEEPVNEQKKCQSSSTRASESQIHGQKRGMRGVSLI